MNYELPVIDSNIKEVSLFDIARKIINIKQGVLDAAIVEIVKLDVCGVQFNGVNDSDCK